MIARSLTLLCLVLAACKHESPVPRDPVVEVPVDATIARTVPDDIDRALERQFDSFKLCYEREIEKKMASEGEVTLKIKIAGSGELLSVSSNHDIAADRCANAVLHPVKLPRTTDGLPTTRTYPFTFSHP